MTVLTRASKHLQSVSLYLTLVTVCFFILQVAWTGFIASDDAYYVIAGLGWVEQFPYIAQHFGTIRASVAIPIAFAIFLLGESEFSVTLSTTIFLVATAILTFHMLEKVVGRFAALLACCALVSTPLFALKATIPCADIPELFFVALSFWLFWQACFAENRTPLLLSSGIAAGLAFSAHELTAALICFYGILFLKAYRLPRHEYLWMLTGFLLVIAIEGLYYGIATGNPAHRFTLLFQATTVHDRVHVDFLQFAAGGTLHIWEPIDPMVMLLTHHDFALLGWLSLPAICWLLVYQREDESKPITLARLALGLGVAWYLLSAILLREMILLPRYYMVTTYCLLIVCAIWVSISVWPKRKQIAIAIFTVAFVANLASISVDNKNPKFAERALVEYLKHTQGVVNTDPLTAHNTYWYCRWEGADCSWIRSGAPTSDAPYFWNPKNTTQPNRFLPKDGLALYQPGPSWEKISSIEESPRPIAIFLKSMGLDGFVPAALWSKLLHPNPIVHLYAIRD